MSAPGVTAFLRFAAKVAVAHVVTYFIAGSIAYQFLTKELYTGSNPLLASYMRTEADPALWSHVVTWFLPANLLRGVLMAAALYPFVGTLTSWALLKRFLSVSALYLIFGFWAAAGAVPGNLEGFVYLRPEFTARVHFIVQPEIIGQGLAFALWLAWWIGPRPARK